MRRNQVAVVGAAETTELGVIPNMSQIQLHADAALNAIADAGLKLSDIDGIATAVETPQQIAHYLGITPKWVDGTAVGGCPGRFATTTAYRFAVVSGKSLSFPYPGAGTPQFLFGTDGGVGNFLRLLEDWNPGSNYIRYRGSIVSLFISRQALGTFKYSNRVYDFGNRKFSFDDDFLLPTKLPPGTPMFRDVNTLTFRQLLRPNQ